jgi:serine/threonine protein kinase
MGSVYLAEQTAVQTHVAIKVLHRDISSDREHVQRFFNEARIVGKIKHSAIVKIFDVGFHNEHAYLVMELLDGESLASRIQRVGRLSVAQIADIGRQTASALAATHDAGIIHRDLKPDNVYIVNDEDLGRRERIKVLDFGIAKLSGTLSAAGPQTAGTMGTPPYMAPEQWGDSGSVDWRADAYSLGCMLFEVACGRPPFIVRTIAEACTQHLTKQPPLASSLVQLPPVLDALIPRVRGARWPRDDRARDPPIREPAGRLVATARGRSCDDDRRELRRDLWPGRGCNPTEALALGRDGQRRPRGERAGAGGVAEQRCRPRSRSRRKRIGHSGGACLAASASDGGAAAS